MDGSPYLRLPLRSEARAAAERQVIADRRELYERMLNYEESRADFLARCEWEQRLGHLSGYLDNELLAWAPLPHTSEAIAGCTLHPDVTAEFWTKFADDCCDWLPIADDLRDTAPDASARWKAEAQKETLTARVKRARDFVRVLRAESAKRRAA